MTNKITAKSINLGVLTNLKLKVKILLGFSVVLLILGGISTFGYIGFTKVAHEVDAYAANVEEASIVSEIEGQFLHLEMYAREFAATGEHALAVKAKVVIKELNVLLNESQKHVANPEDLKVLKEMQHAAEIYEKDFEKSVLLEEELLSLVNDKLHPIGDKFIEDLDKIKKLFVAEGNAGARAYVDTTIRHALSARLYSNLALGASDKTAFDKAEHEFEETHTALGTLGKATHTPEEQKLHKEMTELLKTYKMSFEKAAEDKKAVYELVHGEMAEQAEILLKDVKALKTKTTKEENRIREETAGEIQAAEFGMLSVGLAGMVIGVAISLLLGTFLAKPIIAMTGAMQQLAEGNLEAEIPAQGRKDEIGDMSGAVQVFKESAIRNKELVAEAESQKQITEEEKRKTMNALADDFDASVGGIVETVSSASAELNSTAQSMSSISEETSSQATAVAAASEEASANVQTVASATEEMSASISEINTQVAQASEVSKQAVENVEKTSTQMDVLAQTADKVGEVVSMISDIAEQTNLLALNATIESARAGEAGKGFAVVASEVKALANETAKATEEIATHIQQIQGATKGAVTSIGDIGTVVKQLDETSTAIAAAMEEQGTTTQEISRNVQEASTGTQEVSSSIAGVTQASQEAGAASGQVTSAAGELSQQAELMKTEVEKFLKQVRAA